MASIEEHRSFFAKQMASVARSTDPRLERIFELVPREAFCGPGPWNVQVSSRYVETPSADPIYLYQNSLIALDASKTINNGEPFLHARWIGAIEPRQGETVVHIGAGTGYYTAILSMLVRPGGSVLAYELEPQLAKRATNNLEPFDNATVIADNATETDLPPTDIIYVNAGVEVPPRSWLSALKPEGRMIFPWRPSASAGIALLVTRKANGFSVAPLAPAFFIPCVGASAAGDERTEPSYSTAVKTRSIHFVEDRAPDNSATAAFDEVWFSSHELSDGS